MISKPRMIRAKNDKQANDDKLAKTVKIQMDYKITTN